MAVLVHRAVTAVTAQQVYQGKVTLEVMAHKALKHIQAVAVVEQVRLELMVQVTSHQE